MAERQDSQAVCGASEEKKRKPIKSVLTREAQEAAEVYYAVSECLLIHNKTSSTLEAIEMTPDIRKHFSDTFCGIPIIELEQDEYPEKFFCFVGVE